MENEPIFLDTSFLISYFNEDDHNHTKATFLMEKVTSDYYGTLYISDYIFDEYVTVLLARIKNLSIVSSCAENVKEGVHMISVEQQDFDDAWTFFKKQKGTLLSFTDCVSVVLMKKHRIKDMATFDKEFERLKQLSVIS